MTLRLALTLDQSLQITIDPALLPLLLGWAPVASSRVVTDDPGAPVSAVHASTIVVARGARSRPRLRAEEPQVAMDGVFCWVDDAAGHAELATLSGGHGTIDLVTGEARLVPAPDVIPASGAPAAELRAMCAITAALLLGRREGALVAASAVIAPDGAGWLLVGDASSGKSTTVASLVTSGWSYLADEEVLLHEGANGAVWLEGWPRTAALEDGGAMVQMVRGRPVAGSSRLARGRWRRTAPLTGVLLTRLTPDAPTRLERANADEVLGALVRATPWLLADHVSAGHVLALLRQASRVPAHHLRLGLDTYGDVVRLASCMRPLEAAS